MKLILKLAAFAVMAGCALNLAVAAEVAIPAGKALAQALGDQGAKKESSVYIVRLSEDPLVAYDGRIRGYSATKLTGNKKFNPNSGASKRYKKYLKGRQGAVLAAVGGSEFVYNYTTSYNGFAAKLSGKQAAALRRQAGVVSVVPDELRKRDTISTSTMLDLQSGLWNDLGGVDAAGEDVIVGIIDSGLWPENPSFADTTDLSDSPGNSGKRKLVYGPPPADWYGICRSGQRWSQRDCNNKVIGANWFVYGYSAHGKSTLFGYEYLSARDADGHGSHTASTAAGNAGVPVVINGEEVGIASGMAPKARLAVYKVCWGRGDEGGCFSSDSMAAIDQAVEDGVDVLNYSISGSRTSFLDQVEVAFLFAADAGVFVAASAGNSGPAASTVAHNSPWLTTVAAGTHDRGYEAEVTTGEGGPGVVEGVSLSKTGAGPAALVYSADVVAAGADPDAGRLCVPGSLDAAAVSGRIVLCDRGVIARVDKSRAVAQAGGIGIILANTAPSSVNADYHTVPTVHVDETSGDTLRVYAQTAGATAALSEGTPVLAEASQVAEFSSRGPALAGAGDLLKPDIMAPGVDVVAAVSPDGYNGANFDALSGTSMSSPHMAGLGALMKQLYPDWSPAAIKSAFMTTATQKTNMGNPIDGDAFGYGAGFVQPNAAADPGLVYDAGFFDYLDFLFGPIDPSDLNYPSIAIGSLAGVQTITRTVTDASGVGGVYEWSLDGLEDIGVSIEPSTLMVPAGGTASYSVTFTVTEDAPLGEYVTGGITWDDGIHAVRSAVALRPVELAAPGEISGAGVFGSAMFDVGFGYSGDYSVAVSGLVAAVTTDGNVVDDPADDINTALDTDVGVTFEVVVVPSGASLARFALFDDYTDGDDDLDLYVFGPDTEDFPFAGGSGSGTSAEQVDITNPQPGVYLAVVHGWQTDGPDANYTLFSWAPAGAAGNMTVSSAPAAATLGASGTIEIDWAGLGLEKYLGVLLHQKGAAEIGQTVVNIQND